MHTQTIQLKRFGIVLVSRPAGIEAFNAIRPTLNPNIPIKIDFEDIITVTPSWLDEFLTHLAEYFDGKVELLPTTNASVLAVLPILGIARDDAVADIVRRALDQNKDN
jgi:hypothetical protein